ncbi:MAG: Gfo/Idh/MocA family oxidoreductase [Planctomycetota bacterium]|nr:Gfo/Idh/MocA family oxidoreductase [Planctomycetota bacterium]
MAPRQSSAPSRRAFLKSSALAAPSFWITHDVPGKDLVRRGRLDKLNVAAIGCGGKGYVDAKGCASENLVALCDVDERRGAKLWKEHPEARVYRDFRELLDREKDLDAVLVSTPDHTHAVAAAWAMQRGLHVFCQKPLTHSVEEARVLTMLAQRTGVVTQMGNQGTATDGLRKGVEVIRSGAIGDVREVHVWTNRPIWPQGVNAPAEIQPIPAGLRWDLWLGPARHRSYNEAYCPFRWRGFWDFGTGAIGDMACHTLNLPYLALQLGAPTRVTAEQEGNTVASAPLKSQIRFEFPARGALPPVVLTWHDGGYMPDVEAYLPGVQLSNSGSLMIGDRGQLYSPGDYGDQWRLLPEADFADFEAPAPFLPRTEGIYSEWLDAIKGGTPPMSRFEHAGPFTEAALLGNVAIRAGVPIEWDAARMRITNAPEAERFLRDEYAYGWELGG